MLKREILRQKRKANFTQLVDFGKSLNKTNSLISLFHTPEITVIGKYLLCMDKRNVEGTIQFALVCFV